MFIALLMNDIQVNKNLDSNRLKQESNNHFFHFLPIL